MSKKRKKRPLSRLSIDTLIQMKWKRIPKGWKINPSVQKTLLDRGILKKKRGKLLFTEVGEQCMEDLRVKEMENFPILQEVDQQHHLRVIFSENPRSPHRLPSFVVVASFRDKELLTKTLQRSLGSFGVQYHAIQYHHLENGWLFIDHGDDKSPARVQHLIPNISLTPWDQLQEEIRKLKLRLDVVHQELNS